MLEVLQTDVGKVALGGIIAVSGQIVAAGIGWAKEYWFDAGRRRRDSEYLAMRLVLVFDALVTGCYHAVHDPLVTDQDGMLKSTVPDPSLTLPTEGNYKALSRGLMFQVLSMPSKRYGIGEGLASAWENSGPPDYDEFFEYRREHWSRLGLEALELIDELCREHRIPPPDRPKYYEPKQSFLDEIGEVHRAQKSREKANGELTRLFVEAQTTSKDSDPRAR